MRRERHKHKKDHVFPGEEEVDCHYGKDGGPVLPPALLGDGPQSKRTHVKTCAEIHTYVETARYTGLYVHPYWRKETEDTERENRPTIHAST